MELEERIINTSVMIFKYQKGITSHSLESNIRRNIKEIVDELESPIFNWLGMHGMIDSILEIKPDYNRADVYSNFTDLYEVDEITDNFNNMLGGGQIFGSAVTDEDVLEFILKLKCKQCNQDTYFMNIVNELVNTYVTLCQSDLQELNTIIINFELLKDLNHYNGNFLHDYVDIDPDNINEIVEQRCTTLVA